MLVGSIIVVVPNWIKRDFEISIDRNFTFLMLQREVHQIGLTTQLGRLLPTRGQRHWLACLTIFIARRMQRMLARYSCRNIILSIRPSVCPWTPLSYSGVHGLLHTYFVAKRKNLLQIFWYHRAISLVFRHQYWLRATRFCLKFALKVTPANSKDADFEVWDISAYSVSTVRAGEKVQ